MKRVLVLSCSATIATSLAAIPALGVRATSPDAMCSAVPEGVTLVVPHEAGVALARSTGAEPLGVALPAPPSVAVRAPDGTVWAEVATGAESADVYRVPANGEAVQSASGAVELSSGGALGGAFGGGDHRSTASRRRRVVRRRDRRVRRRRAGRRQGCWCPGVRRRQRDDRSRTPGRGRDGRPHRGDHLLRGRRRRARRLVLADGLGAVQRPAALPVADRRTFRRRRFRGAELGRRSRLERRDERHRGGLVAGCRPMP